MPSPIPSFRYNERAGRFITSQGRFVSERTIRATLDTILDASSAEMVALSKQLQAGTLSLDAWFLAMQQEIKNVHLMSGALVKGGWQQVTSSDYGRWGNIIKSEYQALRKFALEIQSGKQPLNGRFFQRVKQYSLAGRDTYEQERTRKVSIRGFDELKSIRHARDSCGNCIEQESLGYIKIGDSRFIPIGRRQCRRFCQCTLGFRNSVTGQEILA